jgi:hypothetical protein
MTSELPFAVNDCEFMRDIARRNRKSSNVMRRALWAVMIVLDAIRLRLEQRKMGEQPRPIGIVTENERIAEAAAAVSAFNFLIAPLWRTDKLAHWPFP